MKSSYLIIFLFSFTSSVFAEDEPVFPGKCPEVATVNDFQYEKFTGVWYEIKRYPNIIITEQCAVARYVLLQYNNYNITYLSRDLEKETTRKRMVYYDKEIIYSSDIKYDVYFKCKKDDFQHFVLDTDYDVYSVVWGCVYYERKDEHKQRLFIYSRSRTLEDPSTLQKIQDKLNEYGIDASKLEDVEQSDDKCGDIIKEPPIWNECPKDDICKEVDCWF